MDEGWGSIARQLHSRDEAGCEHQIKSTNVSMNALQSLIQRNSYLASVVVLVRKKEGGGRREGKGGEMPSLVRLTQLALSN